MQLLLVHHDAEVGGQLARMVNDYTTHQCDLVDDDAAADSWAQTHPACALLLAQLDGPGVDGLALGATFSEIFPGLQILFLPSYRAAEQQLEIAKTKVFPEPIDGEHLLEVIEAAETTKAGSPDFFHVLDVLQMCCLSGRSGAIQLVGRTKSGIVFLREGKIAHAESGRERGTAALLEMATWDEVEFAYDESVRATDTISLAWDAELIRTIVCRREEKARELAKPKPVSEKTALPETKTAKRGFFGALRRN